MMPGPKLVALISVAGAVVADVGLMVLAAVQSAALPTLGDFGAAGATGAATSLAVLWAWKASTEKRIERIEAEKADKDVVAEMNKSIDRIEQHVTWLVREKRGESR